MQEIEFYTKYAVVLTLLLKKNPQTLQILLYVLWRRKVETEHPDGKWHFHIADIARQLDKDPKTIRKHLKPLKRLELIKETGPIGERYYVFDDDKYQEYLATDPRTAITETPTKERPPSQSVVGVPLPRCGRVKIAERKKAEQYSQGLDGTGIRNSFSVPLPFNEPVPGLPFGDDSVSPHIVNVGASSADLTASGDTENKPSSQSSPGIGFPAPSTSEAVASGDSDNKNINAGSASVARVHASTRHDGQQCINGGTQGEKTAARPSRPVFVVSPVILSLPVPYGIGTAISARRQDAIVKALNKGGCHFKKEYPTHTQLGRFKVCAVDKKERSILVTADDSNLAKTPYIQDLCSEYIPQGWKVLFWTGDDQSIHFLTKIIPPTLSAGTMDEGGQRAA